MDGHSSGPAAGTSPARSSELLGFPRGARVLILNCDDFGMYHAVNAAILRSVSDGIASSCSLMVPCPWALHGMHLLRQNLGIPFGIHLTLVCDATHYRWGPLAAKQRAPSLLDQAGELFPFERIPELLAQARLSEVEIEFRAQIDAVGRADLTPTHLDWHCLADGGRDDIFDLTLALAAEHGLAVRVWREPRRGTLRQQGLPVVDHDFLDSYRMDTDGKQTRFSQLLRDLPAGLSEWAMHPGLGNEESQAIDPYGWRRRQADCEFLTSPQARELIQQEGIVVIDYRAIQQAWSQAGGPA